MTDLSMFSREELETRCRDLERLLEHYRRMVMEQQQALHEALDAARSHINSVRAVLEARQQ